MSGRKTEVNTPKSPIRLGLSTTNGVVRRCTCSKRSSSTRTSRPAEVVVLHRTSRPAEAAPTSNRSDDDASQGGNSALVVEEPWTRKLTVP